MRTAILVILTSFQIWGAEPAKPDFSGDWTLNKDRSDFGNLAMPKKLSERIQHKDPDLRVESNETSLLDVEVKLDLKYKTNGSETENEMLGSKVKNTAKWEDSNLLIHSWITVAGQAIDLRDRWRLTENGQTLIILRRIENASGSFEETLVFDKK